MAQAHVDAALGVWSAGSKLLRGAFVHGPNSQALIDLRDPAEPRIAAANRALLRSLRIFDDDEDADIPGVVRDCLRHVLESLEHHGDEDSVITETQLIDRDGRRFRVEVDSSFLREHGERTYAIIELRDAARREGIERALVESERYLRDIVDNVAALVYLKDLGGRYLLVNRHFEQLYRFRRHEMLGKTDYELFRPEAAEYYRESDRMVLERKEPLEREEPGWHVDGKYLSIKFPLFDEFGRPAAVGGISTDITQRKRAEQSARQAKEEAERANAAKSQLLSRVSHELRTPLNAILGFGQLLQRQALAPEPAADVERIVGAGTHLLTLINEVLEISRADDGGQSMAIEPVHACDPLRDAIELVRPLARERRIDLGCDMHGGLYRFVRADAHRLKQIILNVLANAVKYTPEGGCVRVRFEPRADRLRYLVADTGPGIDEGDWDRVFVPFERLGADLGQTEGTGLGLALSHSLAEAMGGSIGVARSDGDGTTFFIELPLIEAPENIHEAVLGDANCGKAGGTGLVGARVLYIEDDQSNIDVVTRVLRVDDTTEVVPAMRGRLGLEFAERSEFDLIIVDLHLPDLEADELIRALRAQPNQPDVPILVLSADATAGQSERLLGVGADQYLTKPLDIAAFLASVGSLLAARPRYE